MTTVRVNASTEYDVVIGKGLLDNAGKLISSVITPCKAAIISDDKVLPLYGNKVRKSLENAGFSVCEYAFPNGENSKSIDTFAKILDFLAKNRLCRTDIVVALGGGVAGDMAGFCAASYLRGIRFVQIPTTVLAASDSSVGGKTAVNLPSGKNLAGAFHQPSLVICDTDTFLTLDKRQISCGFAEIIKYGVICDKALFDELDSSSYDMEKIITRCVEIKRDIVEQDEKESGPRKLLNFGHTLGHAVEKHSGFSLTHGEAVCIGMIMISRIAEKRELCHGVTEKISALAKAHGLPTEYGISKAELFELATGDKKAEKDSITLVLPETVGKCFLSRVSFDEFSDMLDILYEVR